MVPGELEAGLEIFRVDECDGSGDLGSPNRVVKQRPLLDVAERARPSDAVPSAGVPDHKSVPLVRLPILVVRGVDDHVGRRAAFVNAHVSTSEALSRSRLIVAVAVIGDFVPKVSVSVPVAQVHVPTRDVASSERSVGLPGFVGQFGCALATPTVIKDLRARLARRCSIGS